MSNPLRERLIEVWKLNKFTLREKLSMSTSLLMCIYYELKARRCKHIVLQRGYDSMYLAHWVHHKRIFYKPLDSKV